MKQRITVEQLNELTEEQKARLREWWQPEEGDIIFAPSNEYVGPLYDDNEYFRYDHTKTIWGYGFPDSRIKRAMYPLLSIGQCIALLGEKVNDIIPPWSPHNSEPNEWQVYSGDGFWDSNELIDALWEAVKAVL